MFKIKRVYLLLILVVLSCSDDDGVSVNNRNETLFGQWEYEAITSDTAVDINGDGTVNIDFYNTNEIRQCLKDNLTFFASRGGEEKNEFTINENGLSCGEVNAFETVESDKYELVNDEILRFNNRNEMRIIEFDKNRLILEQNDFLDEQEVIITYTYKRS